MLAWLVLLPASIAAAFEALKQASDDNARTMLAFFFASGAILEACIGYTCGRSIMKSALWGVLIWPAIGCVLAILTGFGFGLGHRRQATSSRDALAMRYGQ
ncbi:MAG TPA: hypothetical protein VFI31_20025 [Pirellulales bacterium]|nr:hypothetical protein [Pirellulales bacterium]